MNNNPLKVITYHLENIKPEPQVRERAKNFLICSKLRNCSWYKRCFYFNIIMSKSLKTIPTSETDIYLTLKYRETEKRETCSISDGRIIHFNLLIHLVGKEV